MTALAGPPSLAVSVGLADWTADQRALGLAELNARAALQTRVDRKYILTLDRLTLLLRGLQAPLRVLEIDGLRAFRYESTYFDTPHFLSHRLAATRRRRRFKVRSRSYLDSQQCWLEVKTVGPRGSTVKTRTPHPFAERGALGPGLRFVDEVLGSNGIVVDSRELQPALLGTYRRTTVLIENDDSRLTIDTDLTWRCSAGHAHAPFLAVVETKSSGGASSVDRALWAAGCRPSKISKYATGLAAIRPELPDVPWRRTLRRHFDLP